MILSAIAAMSRNRVIGKDNKLPWHLPEDFKHFKQKTNGHILIMGRKTFDSLPGALPGRFHLVITRDVQKTYEAMKDRMKSDVYAPEIKQTPTNTNFAVVSTISKAIELADEMIQAGHPLYRPEFGNEVFVAGGGEIYKQSMNQLDRIYLTVIEKDFEGTAFFPEYDESQFKLTERIDRTEPMPFSIRTYERKPRT